MKPTIIIPIRQSDAWFSVGIKDGCTTGMPTTATLKVWRPNCVRDIRECIGVNACGNRTYRVTTPVTPSVTLTTRTIDCQGRAVFDINSAFVALGKGRLEATLTTCAGDVNVSLQVFSSPVVASFEVGEYTQTTPYILESVTVGLLALLVPGCFIPEGWVPVHNCTTDSLIGYARETQSLGFCKSITLPCGNRGLVWVIEP